MPALNSRERNTASSSALAGNICFYSSLNTRLFPKSQEADRLLRFLNLSQQSSRLYAGISSALARRPKSAPAPGDLEALLEETQWESTVRGAGGAELVGQSWWDRAGGTHRLPSPSLAMCRAMRPGHPLLSGARLTHQLMTLQGSRFCKVEASGNPSVALLGLISVIASLLPLYSAFHYPTFRAQAVGILPI